MVDTAATEATGTEDGKKTGTVLTGKGDRMNRIIDTETLSPHAEPVTGKPVVYVSELDAAAEIRYSPNCLSCAHNENGRCKQLKNHPATTVQMICNSFDLREDAYILPVHCKDCKYKVRHSYWTECFKGHYMYMTDEEIERFYCADGEQDE